MFNSDINVDFWIKSVYFLHRDEDQGQKTFPENLVGNYEIVMFDCCNVNKYFFIHNKGEYTVKMSI